MSIPTRCFFYITGDFNQLDISKQCSDSDLTQIVQSVTRGRHTLDLFLTNREDIVSCTVDKSCLNTDHSALMVNCNRPISYSVSVAFIFRSKV